MKPSPFFALTCAAVLPDGRVSWSINTLDDDSKRSAFGELPVVANYFYHEEVKKSAKKL